MRTRLVLVLVLGTLLSVPREAEAERQPPPLSFQDWIFWFYANREWLDPPRTLPDAVDANLEKELLPTVLWATDIANAGHGATQAAAHLALGKVARDQGHVDRLLEGASKTSSAFQAPEAATLALGLLRRSDPARRFDAKTLDRVRDRLLATIADDEYPVRTRGMAALSIGLLGDQPTADGRAPVTTERLFALLRNRHPQGDLRVGLLMAIGAQEPDSVAAAQLEVLRGALQTGRLFKDDLSYVLRACVAQTLGRVGTVDDAEPLRVVALQRRGVDDNLRRCSVLALGTLATRLDGDARRAIEKELRAMLGSGRVRDATTRSIATLSLARAVAADFGAGEGSARGTHTSVQRLLATAGPKGKYVERPYAALGLGLVARAAGGKAEAAARSVREKAVGALRRRLRSQKADARERAAFAVALGIAGDEGSIDDLRGIAGDVAQDRPLRGYAAWALGRLGAGDAATLSALRGAVLERTSAELSILALTALSFVSTAGADRRLALDELKTARSQPSKGQAAAALARLGAQGTMGELAAIVRSRAEQDLTRMMAVAGLGRLGDPEPLPSLARLTSHVNHRLRTDLLNELFSVL